MIISSWKGSGLFCVSIVKSAMKNCFFSGNKKKKRFLFVEMCLYCYICMAPGVLDMSVTILVHILATVFAKDTLLTGG